MKLFAIALLLSLTLAELAARFFFPNLLGFLYSWDSELGLIPKPGGQGHVYSPRLYHFHFTHDEKGFRKNADSPSWEGRKWIFIGDSMVYGVGVADGGTFAAKAEKLLREKGQNIQVLNAGAPGRGPDYYLRLLEKVRDEEEAIERYFVFFTGYNDWKDSLDALSPSASHSDSFWDHLRLWRLGGRAFQVIHGSFKEKAAAASGLENPTQEQYEAAVRFLKQIHQTEAVTFVYLPSIGEVELFRAQSQRLPLFLRFTKAMEQIQADFRDLLPPLAFSSIRTEELFLARDGHYSEKAHEIIAGSLAITMAGVAGSESKVHHGKIDIRRAVHH